MFAFLKKKKKGGYISALRLDDWFYSTFSKEEIEFMENKYHPMGLDDSECPLTEGNQSYNADASYFLANLIEWVYSKERANMCLKIAEKAEELQDLDSMDITNRHFYYQHLIQFYYKLRENPGVLEKVIRICNDAISIAPKVAKEFLKEFPSLSSLPRHVAFEQLAIIEKKRKNWEKVIEICKEASSQNWAGTWDARIQEAEKNLEKEKKKSDKNIGV